MKDSSRMTVADVPDGPAAEWAAVFRDTKDGRHWVMDADQHLHLVTADAAGNWVASRGAARVFCRDGTLFRPADDPIPDADLERSIIAVARDRVAAGHPLSIEDEARLRLAIERTKEAA